MAKRNLTDYVKFLEILNKSKNIVALTGAGISTESGIPVFRGLWKTYRATDLATPEAFKINPSLVWEFYNYRREIAFSAQPNKAHLALKQYENICQQQSRNFTIITQNVDGLHIKAGSENVIELHGSLRKVICTKCKEIEENLNSPICSSLKGRDNPDLSKDLPIIAKEQLPKCRKCNSLVRPYIVWFGENLDLEILNKSRELVNNCDFCLVIGTSSIIYPAAMFAPSVAECHKPVAEFNLNEEPADDRFMFHFCGPCGTTLPRALGIK